MKKILYISIILFTVSSCKDDFIEESSTINVPIENAIRTKDNLEQGVLGVYSGLAGEQFNDLFNFSEIITDNGMLSNSYNGQYAEIYNMTYSPSTSKVNRLWNGLNDVIIKANWVLSFEGKIVYDSTSTETEADFNKSLVDLYSEAKILRAYARLLLANFFCERYGGDNQQLGLVINNNYDPYNITETYPRSTVQETYDAIESDLLYAYNNMRDNIAGESIIAAKATRMNKLAAEVLLSRVYLYKRDWAKSIQFSDFADALLNARTSITESTITAPFPNGDNQNTSSIFQYAWDSGNNLSINSLSGYWSTAGTYKQFYATNEFFSLMSATDKRASAIYTKTTSIYDNPTTVYLVKKFGLNNLFDNVLIRKAEINFNKIEATYYSDPIAARTLLNDWVKTNRDASYNSTSTGSAILNDILLQRRIEFAFEGYRFIDLKRNDLGWTKGANYKGSHPSVLITDKEQCLPIPIIEMTVNPKMVQNPGY